MFLIILGQCWEFSSARAASSDRVRCARFMGSVWRRRRDGTSGRRDGGCERVSEWVKEKQEGEDMLKTV